MQFPVIHLNGTDGATLRDNYLLARNAAEALLKALRECCPNGRDYYPISQSAATAAMQEHIQRLAKVEDVRRDMEALALWVIDQNADRETA